MTTIDAVLDFWFAEGMAERWFVKDPAFDAEVRAALEPGYQEAREGRLDDWMSSARGCLALCILLDQAPRNLFRADPRAFASDPQARSIVRHALGQGFQESLSQIERLFLYLPLEHSEDLKDQEDCLALTMALDENPSWYDYAVAHRDIIARFGRFPHRNEVLGREATPEEAAFLREPNSSF
ncbi:DUF924 domain-containing protein [Denitrobaculum tricleocarpae]|uniref:DUF924 domain-containing protein n=1 Tax=Denitrobaculum tricleocarpae TaxID=2591009 RepID=A0A545U293_9PROT|nr:DUF924 domain-containing protein [Denitrobaculum tricleocarpae]